MRCDASLACYCTVLKLSPKKLAGPPNDTPDAGLVAGKLSLGVRGHRASSRRADLLRALLVVPFLVPFGAMLQRHRARGQPASQPLAADVPLGLSVVGEVIVHRHSDGRIAAWSARCTHLGCRLDRVIDGVVVCPCHGSRFDDQGDVLNGPASRPLRSLTVEAAAEGGWVVHLVS